MPKAATSKWPRVQFVFICRSCDVKITLSIYYGGTQIWNNRDAAKLAQWVEHEGHDTELQYEFYAGRGS